MKGKSQYDVKRLINLSLDTAEVRLERACNRSKQCRFTRVERDTEFDTIQEEASVHEQKQRRAAAHHRMGRRAYH